MDEEHKNALEGSLHDICQDLDAEDILPYLRAKGVVKEGQAQEIMKITRKSTQNMQLIDYIKGAGPSAFHKFINALQLCKKTYLVEKILARISSVPIQQSLQELNITQASSTSSTTSSHPNAEEWKQQLKITQQSLKEMYLTRFQNVHPFSLPFTFDIENTWVSLALKDGAKNSQATDDHVKVLSTAFEKAKMLIIEGNPAMGKTSLMRRLAYEWATEKKELSCFDLIIYAEFREVREQKFESIADLVIQFNMKYDNFIECENFEYLKLILSNKRYCEEHRILLLLDGYDESSLDKQCNELSTYISSSAIQSPLMFHVVLTTRPGYLSKYRGNKGRFIFAELLGFRTKEQKDKYILKHFLTQEIDDKENIAAVHHLLDRNQNLDKLAETPLFLTFICLVHERIVDGTILELYCNIIWWLLDRHQKDFPDRDIPALFGYQNGSSDKFETIQDHYLQFPQLRNLGNMALRNLEENVFKPSDCAQYNLQPIIEQVGLLRKERNHDKSFKLATSFFFPHRTIQEFLAAFYSFCSNDHTSEWLLPDSISDPSEKSNRNPSGMNEFERFLFRIALSDKMPIQAEKRKYYFERIFDIDLDITFDAFNTTTGFNNQQLNWFLSQCTNVQNIRLRDEMNSAGHARPMLNDPSIHNASAIISIISNPTLFSFSNLIKLHSLTFWSCAFEAISQLSFSNCPFLKDLIFNSCKMKSNINLGIATLPAIDTVKFYNCTFDLTTWQSITDQMRSSSVKCLRLEFREYFSKEFLIHLQQCSNLEKMEITIHDHEIRQNDLLSFGDLINLHSLTFWSCKFEAISQLSFTNCPFLKDLIFGSCKMKGSTIVGIVTLPAIDTVQFYECTFDLTTWQSITNQIRSSSVKCLRLEFREDFSKEFLIHLQQCSNLEKMEITIHDHEIRQNDLLSFGDLIKLHSLTFRSCTFEAISQFSFTNCPSLKNLKFKGCKIVSSTSSGAATLPKIDSVEFDSCTFSADSQLSFINCPSLKDLIFRRCKMKSSAILGIATLPAIDTVQFYECTFDLTTWQSITNQIKNSFVKCLLLTFGKYFNKEFLIHLQKCESAEMKITISRYKIYRNDMLVFSDLNQLHSLVFTGCTFEADSQLSFINCASLKDLRFRRCKMKSSTIVGIATLPVIDTVIFYECIIDLANMAVSYRFNKEQFCQMFAADIWGKRFQ